MIMIMMVHVGIKIYPKFIPKIFPYTSSPNFTGKMVDAFWNVMDSEDYNVYNVWIRSGRCVGWEYQRHWRMRSRRHGHVSSMAGTTN